jgi:hypothetical protein
MTLEDSIDAEPTGSEFRRGPTIELSELIISPARPFSDPPKLAAGPIETFVRGRLKAVDGLSEDAIDETFAFSRQQVSAELLDSLSTGRGPGVEGEHVSGLVVGSIQSGKTISFSTVTAICLDSGASAVVVISGSDTNLRDQTRNRMRKYFGEVLDVVTTLEFAGHELDRSRKNIARNIADGDRKTIIVAMKEDDHLGEVRSILRLSAYSIGEESPPVVVVIDDEADQASLNNQSYKKNANKSSTLHSILIDICNSRIVAGYVGYTATAYPNALSDRSTAVYPKDFVAVLEPAKGYPGLLSFFNRTGEAVSTVIGFSEFLEDAADQSIDDALDYFMVLCELRARESDFEAIPAFPANSGGLVMGVNSGIRVKTHEEAATRIDARLDGWFSGSLRATDFSRIRKFAPPEAQDAIDNLLANDQDWIKGRAQALRSNVFTLNSTGGAPDFDSPVNRIVVGGQLLGRGFTLPNLVAYALLPSQDKATMDVLQQRARFLGYRDRYLDWVRVWMPTPTVQSYRDLEMAEDSFREACRRLQDHRLGLDALEPYLVLAGHHNPARRGVIAMGAKVDPSWYKSSIGTFDTPQSIKALAEKVLSQGVSSPEDRNAYRLNIDSQTARALVQEFCDSAPADRAMMLVAVELAFGPKKDPDTELMATVFVMSEWEKGRHRERDSFGNINQLFSGRSGQLRGEADVFAHDTALSIQLHRLQSPSGLGVGMAIRPTSRLNSNRAAWIWA